MPNPTLIKYEEPQKDQNGDIDPDDGLCIVFSTNLKFAEGFSDDKSS